MSPSGNSTVVTSALTTSMGAGRVGRRAVALDVGAGGGGELGRDLDADNPSERSLGGEQHDSALAAAEVNEGGCLRLNADSVEHPLRDPWRGRQVENGGLSQRTVVNAQSIRFDGASRVRTVPVVEGSVGCRLIRAVSRQQLHSSAPDAQAGDREPKLPQSPGSAIRRRHEPSLKAKANDSIRDNPCSRPTPFRRTANERRRGAAKAWATRTA